MKTWRTILALALLMTAASASAGWFRPRWTRAKPHIETRGGKRVAVAVGMGRDENVSLARSVAQDRGRAALLHLLQDKPPFSDVEGHVRLAVPVEYYQDGPSTFYVRMELVLAP
jgi:hypothetical protein